ncbi:rRNA processing/ribosome biogenesis-domain-containing protein [Xylariaceae sp. FL0594]|nr:rRNA processing/ribosome biogenesis-domain-containing protein [Xylariaceae sp. FL0594]
MALVALPSELRSLCRRLASTKAEQLPPLLPALLKDVARCQEPLSRPVEAKPSSESSRDAADLVHKLKTQITSLLKSRTSQGRFVGAALVKAVVESGGWEALRASEPWVRELIAIVQKKELAVVKDLCIVALVKIFTLMQQHPTLVREIVTPNLSPFATACLQILKPPVSSKVAKAPYSLVETIFEAISTVVVLHPTTLRASAAKFRSELRPYLVPTTSDSVIVPVSLQESSRRLAIRLHMTIAKGGDSTEWTRHVEELVKAVHCTADQVFRAVQENWESTIGHRPQAINIEIEAQGGSDDATPDQFPRWVGVQAGGERIIGLLDFIGAYLRHRTRTTVSIPLTAILDIASRITSIRPPKDKSDAARMMNPAIGREERDELWTVFPDIQIAVLRLHIAVVERLGRNYIPLAPAALEQTLRVFQSVYRLPGARETAFSLIREILHLCGPTLPRFTVESLGLVTKCCCRDLLGAAGQLKKAKAQSSSDTTTSKTKNASPDAFLPGSAQDAIVSVSLSREHLAAASDLLVALFSHLPQEHIPSSLRTQMLRTAILCRLRDAQVASVLHPARDRGGRVPAVILPYLSRQFPADESVELLRFNFRPLVTGPPAGGDFMDVDVDDDEDGGREGEGEDSNATFPFGRGFDTQDSSIPTPTPIPTHHQFKKDPNANPNPIIPTSSPFFLAQPQPQPPVSEADTSTPTPTPTTSLKRKTPSDTAETETVLSSSKKRVEVDISAPPSHSGAATTSTTIAAATTTTTAATISTNAQGEGSDDDDDESVHLNMELDSDSDSDEEEAEE